MRYGCVNLTILSLNHVRGKSKIKSPLHTPITRVEEKNNLKILTTASKELISLFIKKQS